jgi:hypothetical protein
MAALTYFNNISLKIYKIILTSCETCTLPIKEGFINLCWLVSWPAVFLLLTASSTSSWSQLYIFVILNEQFLCHHHSSFWRSVLISWLTLEWRHHLYVSVSFLDHRPRLFLWPPYLVSYSYFRFLSSVSCHGVAQGGHSVCSRLVVEHFPSSISTHISVLSRPTCPFPKRLYIPIPLRLAGKRSVTF